MHRFDQSQSDIDICTSFGVLTAKRIPKPEQMQKLWDQRRKMPMIHVYRSMKGFSAICKRRSKRREAVTVGNHVKVHFFHKVRHHFATNNVPAFVHMSTSLSHMLLQHTKRWQTLPYSSYLQKFESGSILHSTVVTQSKTTQDSGRAFPTTITHPNYILKQYQGLKKRVEVFV
jgi:hypothetical protein